MTVKTIDFNNNAELEQFRSEIAEILSPINKVIDETVFTVPLPFDSRRTAAGRKLSSYYLVYFLLVDLMEFQNDGRFDKTAWSVRIEYKGIGFVIEHRKMGVGVFGNVDYEKEAEEVTTRINKAIRKALPYFEFLALEAAKRSELNVFNKSTELYSRYKYFLKKYKGLLKKIDDKKTKELGRFFSGSFKFHQKATWYAIAAIDAFFSWTEHVFILISILKGSVTTGEQVADLADHNWPDKFKSAIPLSNSETTKIYNELIEIRRQIRNFIAHGSFGKNGEAFQFHSGAGAVPMMLPHKINKSRYTFISTGFKDKSALETIEKFGDFIWAAEREPAKMYIHDNSLPLILTMSTDGRYAHAMESVENMAELCYWLQGVLDDNANMDF